MDDRANEAPVGSTVTRDRFASLREALARRGYTLLRLDSGAYLIARWGLTRQATDLYAARNFLNRIAGVRYGR